MSNALGKRKRVASAKEREETTEPDNATDIQTLLRQHFEARFGSLSGIAPQKPGDAGEDDDSDDNSAGADSDSDEWGGISEEDDDEPPQVQVVDYTTPLATSNTGTMSKKELKAYLSSRPPTTSTTTPNPLTTKKKPDPADPEDSAAFLANDLALQRLIAESHLLAAAGGNASHYQSSAAAATLTATRAFADGRTRQRATDMRLQALGAKASLFAQERMPMAMRKGMARAAGDKEERRRREARENGIVLERFGGGGRRRRTWGAGEGKGLGRWICRAGM
ncbi:hypothetical protein B0T18DRAFT_441137 [Schizothecium vesticola]|uniref:Uncharacterized protein n=1 Tax=Schizothecium vesticola TaxID=314040 RepID=A0AA40EFW7_9PEZI|nr:hypothetical protein B0T18DRAFT_441137 [Schizothecium vesticola]